MAACQMIETVIADGSQLADGENAIHAHIAACCHGWISKGNVELKIPVAADIDKERRRARRGNDAAVVGVMPSLRHDPEEKRVAILDYGSVQGVPTSEAVASKPARWIVTKDQATPSEDSSLLDDEGLPCDQPPMGTTEMLLILKHRRNQMESALGEFPNLTARGIPPTALRNLRRPLVTAEV